VGYADAKKPLEELRHNIKMDLREVRYGAMDGIDLAQDRNN
jgi:hypothetical protein